MNTSTTPLYQDTVLLHLGCAVRRLGDDDQAPALLRTYADRILEKGRAVACGIEDAPDFFQETLRWSLDHVDQITSLWAHDLAVLAAGVHASAYVLKATAFLQGRAISSTVPGRTDRRTKLGRRQSASYTRAHVLAGAAERMAVLPIQFRLSASDDRMLRGWSSQLDSSARLYGLAE